MVFYDGGCGLCHRAVRFILAHDRDGAAFRFAPLDSESFRAKVDPAARAALPDTMVVRTAEGILLTRSRGVIHILSRLGGLWAIVAMAARLIPRPIRDGLYNQVARSRRHFFAPPGGACPVVPAALRERFDLEPTKR